MSERLLTVSPDFQSSPGGGAVIGELLRISMGIESLHITPGTPDGLIRLRFEKLLGRTILGTYLPLTMRSRRSLARFLTEWSPTVVHANGFGHPLVDSIAQLALSQKRRVVVTVHGLVDLDGRGRRWAKPIAGMYLRRRKRILQEAEAVTCPFDEVAESISPICSRPVDVIHWGVRSSPPVEAQLPVRPFPALIALGRLSERKNYELLVRALSRVREEFSDANLTILGGAGDRTYERRLVGLIDELNLVDAVHLTGSVSPEMSRAMLNAAHVYVSVSARETFGLATLEACADGVPVVATSVAVAPSVVSRETGRLVSVEADETQIADAIMEVVSNFPDFKARSLDKAPLIRDAFAWDKTVEGYKRVFGLPLSERIHGS